MISETTSSPAALIVSPDSTKSTEEATKNIFYAYFYFAFDLKYNTWDGSIWHSNMKTGNPIINIQVTLVRMRYDGTRPSSGAVCMAVIHVSSWLFNNR